jgi:hypothetical protein
VSGAGAGSGATRPGPAGSAWADAIAAITGAAAAAGGRFGLGELPVWQVAAAVSQARLLLPGWPDPGSPR